jgi:hypothetical protein
VVPAVAEVVGVAQLVAGLLEHLVQADVGLGDAFVAFLDVV